MKLGIALGAGGANGLAHIRLLEALDEVGVRPHHVAGASMGAVIGGLYCAGMSGADIRALAESLVIRDGDSWGDILRNKRIGGWTHFLDPAFGQGGLIDGGSFLRFLYESVAAQRLEDLSVPLSVVATDFWARDQVVFDTGALLPAVEASMAMPGVFRPVSLDGRVYVDGGAVNPVPFDVLASDCDFTVAVDVIGQRSPSDDLSTFDVVFNTFQIMQESIVSAKRRYREPDVYIDPGVRNVRALEFYRLEDVFRQAAPAAERLREMLLARLEPPTGA